MWHSPLPVPGIILEQKKKESNKKRTPPLCSSNSSRQKREIFSARFRGGFGWATLGWGGGWGGTLALRQYQPKTSAAKNTSKRSSSSEYYSLLMTSWSHYQCLSTIHPCSVNGLLPMRETGHAGLYKVHIFGNQNRLWIFDFVSPADVVLV